MLIFKFGGASVKDEEGVKNVKKIIDFYPSRPLLIVVSAMGKTTNALEEVVKSAYFKKDDTQQKIEVVEKYHADLINDLFVDNKQGLELLKTGINAINEYLNTANGVEYDEMYDQIVSKGEWLSTQIISVYLNASGLENTWLDAKDYIKTDDTFREGGILWSETQAKIDTLKQQNSLFITQGFVGGTADGKTTTLGREGSDYTASIFAYCLKADSVSIWKDVPGVLSADPRLFSDCQKFNQLSYQEAIEMTYYGATVIHPKTIKPLQNANIPLYVKPFLAPAESGTVINADDFLQRDIPAIIVKSNQVLISISSQDFSFFSEADMAEIFGIFNKHHVKINVSQNSALSFSVCVDFDEMKFGKLIKALEQHFKIRYNDGLTLYTVRHYHDKHLDELFKDKTIVLEQYSRSTAQVVFR
jgi:aspartate kinase